MHYLLIDTNCLLDLLSDSEEKNFRLWQHWIEASKIKLLVPERLLEEWYRQKERHLREVKENHNKAAKNVNASVRRIMEAGYERIINKAKLIDHYLAGGESCRTSKATDEEVGKRYRKGIAPFHKNPNSHGDAYIYFTSVYHLRKRRQKELFFITRDKAAFGHPEREEEALHPDLEINGLEVQYFYTLERGIHRIRQQIGGIPDELVDLDTDYEPVFYVFKAVDKQPLVDQVFLALEAYYDQMPFIPTHLLVRLFPFKVVDVLNNYTYHSSFHINSNNKKLVELFSSIVIGKNNKLKFQKPEFFQKVKDKNEKVHTILKRLNANLINHISASNSGIEADITYLNKEEDEAQDLFNQLDFVGAYNRLKDRPPKEVTEAMKQAYMYFQFGNFQKSLKFFDYVYEKAKQQGKHLLAFICLYNMKRLKELIRGHFSAIESDTQAILKKVNNASVKRYRIDYVNEPSFVQEAMEWVAGSDFYHDACINLSEVVEDIRNHFDLQLVGGTSSNYNYQRLLSTFGEIDQFLEQNCVIFNNYSNYGEMVEKFIEGVFMIYNFSNNQPNKILYIHNYLLLKMIPFAKREQLIRYYNRYHLLGLENGNDENSSIDFLQAAIKLISDYPRLKVLLAKDQVFTFWDRYNKIFGNLLLVLTLSKSTLDLSLLTEQLVKLLREETFLRKFDDTFIADLLREKGKYISAASLKLFVEEAIDNPKLHESAIFRAIQHLVSTHHQDLIINDETKFRKIKENFFKKCTKCNSFHQKDLLVSLYQILDPKLQKRLTKLVVNSLTEEFNPELYYTYAINGIIDYALFWDQFMATCPRLENKEHRSFWGNKTASYSRLNELINLAYKFNISLTSEPFDKYRHITPYYDWLLDLEGFTYQDFCPEWILEYKTTVYYKKIFACDKVINAVSSYLIKTKHPFLSDLFIRYTKADDSP